VKWGRDADRKPRLRQYRSAMGRSIMKFQRMKSRFMQRAATLPLHQWACTPGECYLGGEARPDSRRSKHWTDNEDSEWPSSRPPRNRNTGGLLPDSRRSLQAWPYSWKAPLPEQECGPEMSGKPNRVGCNPGVIPCRSRKSKT